MALGEGGIQLTLKGSKELLKKLKKGTVKISAKKMLHARIGINLLKLINKGFKTEGVAVTGKKWKGLAASTQAGRRRGGGKGGPRILQDKGILRQSFTMNVKSKEVRVGTAIKYSKVHEFGGRKKYIIRPKNKRALMFMGPKGVVFAKSVVHPKLAKRKMLPVNKIAQALITKTYDNFVKEGLKKARLK